MRLVNFPAMKISLSRSQWYVASGVFIFALAFAIYTQHAWEDWYITFRPAKNLATGHGLVYNDGERVHTFTSVIGTLIPALLSAITFNTSDDLVLWLFRIVNMGVLSISAVLLVKASGKWFVGLAPMALLVGGTFLDAKTVDFSINGMETPYTVLGLVLFFYFITSTAKENLGVRLGFVWALLQYARPDGVIFSLALMIGMLLFLGNRQETLRVLLKSAAVASLLFAPWLLFTWWYYGTPIPHTIVAKGLNRTWGLDRFLDFLKAYASLHPSELDSIYTPPYSRYFNILPVALFFSRVLAFLSSLIWLSSKVKPVGRIASLGFLGYVVYLSAVTPFPYPWYVPGATLLSLTALACWLDAAGQRKQATAKSPHLAGWITSGLFLAFALSLTLVSAHQFRAMQNMVESGHRQKIAHWLKQNSSPGQTVFLECVGYIGYYSALKTYDYPGMTSPEIVKARRELGTNDWAALISRLEPTWLVLRMREAQILLQQDSAYMTANYEPVKFFDISAKIDDLRFKPFEAYFRHDAQFVVVRRISPTHVATDAIQEPAK
jgi:hypothetical protein